MLILVGAFLVSLIPSILLFLWLKKQNGENEEYKKTCDKALIQGFLSVIWLTLVCFVLALSESLLKISRFGPIWQEAYHTFIVVVLPEEIVKMFLLSRFLKKMEYRYSWRDIVAFQIIINLGFSMIEDLVYAFITTPGQMLVRGVFIMHGGYGYVMGYFFAKAKATKNKMYYIPALLIPLMLHGLYDFTLDDKVAAINDLILFTPLIMVITDVVLLVRMFNFFKKTKDQELYTAPVEN